MMKRMSTVTIILCCFVLLLAGRVAFAGGVTVIGSLTKQAALKPGDRTEGRIQIQNTSNEPREVRIYKSDYMRHADGTSDYKDPGSVARSNSAWITFTPEQLTVPAGESAFVYYTVQTPQDDKLIGTYWSLLMVEPLAKGSLEPPKKEDGKISLGIQTVLRYAVQIITDIGDTGKRDIKFIDKQLVVQDKQRVLQLDIENTGERKLTPLVWAEVYDTNGVSLGRFEGGRSGLYPGCSRRFSIDLSSLSGGNYNALILADNGDEYVFGTQYNLELP